jgi:DNA-binding winged helix-turn-helix (wHTH) protein/tetratricopeptide (TPR) repeat protein
MAMSPLAQRTEKPVYEFDGFRVDPIRRRLLRGGELVPLTPKAFSILLVLLEKRGEVMEKDELIERVWPDTHVSEANLTQNVSSLRKALGERANDHRYVVTVPGRGYSFVAEVFEVSREETGEFAIPVTPTPDPQPVPAPSAPVIAAPPAIPQAALPRPATGPIPIPAPQPEPTASALDSTLVQFPPAPRGRRRFLFAGLALGFLFALLVIAGFLFYKGQLRPMASPGSTAQAPAARPTMAVLGFRNLSADRKVDWLSTALSEMLITELSAGSRVRMVSGEEIARMKQTLSIPYVQNLSGDSLQQIQERLGADLVVFGSFLSLGEHGSNTLRIDLRVMSATSGETVASMAEVGREDDLFSLVSRIGSRLRSTLGWITPSPEETRAAQALLPRNPDASRLYSEGLVRLRAFDPREARDMLRQAAEADPESAAIRSALSLAWSGLGDDARAVEEADKAVQLSASLSQRDRLTIQARAFEAKKDWAQASELYHSLWTFYPDDLEYGLRLANSLSAAGRGTEALAVVADMRKLPPPEGVDPRIDLVEGQIGKRVSNFRIQMRAAKSAEEKGRKSGETQVVAEALILQGDALLLVGRSGEAIPLFEQSRDLFAKAGNQGSMALVLTHLGVTLHEQGRLAEAEKMYQGSLAALQKIGNTQGVAMQVANLGLLYQDIGDLPRAQPLLEQGLAAFASVGDRVMEARAVDSIGTVLLARGDLAGARQRFDQVLVTVRQTGNRTDEVRTLNHQGLILALQGSLREAQRLQDQAAEIARQVGDPVRGASAVAASADALARLGDLAEARRRLTQALDMKRKGEDQIGTAEVLGRLALLQERTGNLAEVKRLGAEQTALVGRLGSRSLSASALKIQALLNLDQGNLAEARRQLEEVLRLRTQNDEQVEAAEAKLWLSNVARLGGDAREAVRLATEAEDWYGKRDLAGFHALALARLAQALLADGRRVQARSVADQAQTIAEAGKDLDLRIAVAIAVAPVRAASGDGAAAQDLLRWALRESERTGAVAPALEARLELGFLQLRGGNPVEGGTTLETLRRDAEVRGFQGLARRAQAALQGGVVMPKR